MLLNEIYQWARSAPTKPALIYNDTVWDYAAFAKSIAIARDRLQKDELPPGTTVLVLARNLFTSWPIIIALRSLGLNTLTVPSLEVAQALQITDLSRIVTTQRGYEFFELGSHLLPGLGITSLPNFVHAEIHAAAMPETPSGSGVPGAHILITSGTTGIYKKLKVDGVTEQQQNLIRARPYSIDSSTVFQCNDAQPWTQVGFRTPCAVWNAGGCVVFNQTTRETQSALDPIKFFRHNINLSIIIPWQLKELLEPKLAAPDKHNECRLYVTAGFLPRALARDAIGKLTNQLNVSYGSTELCAAAMVSCPNNDDAQSWLVPTVGRCVQVVDDAGNECEAGREGEVRIRCEDTDCSAYLDDEATTARFFHDGFFYPGDMAVSRDDGAIRILGRVSDVINVRGEKFALGPIEQVICQHLQINEACLFSDLSAEGQEEVIVALETATRPPNDQLDWIQKRFVTFDRIRFVCLPEFPRTETGTKKVRRRELKALIQSEKD